MKRKKVRCKKGEKEKKKLVWGKGINMVGETRREREGKGNYCGSNRYTE